MDEKEFIQSSPESMEPTEKLVKLISEDGKQNDLGLSTEVFHNLNFSFFKNILSAFCIKKKVPKVCKVCQALTRFIIIYRV